MTDAPLRPLLEAKPDGRVTITFNPQSRFRLPARPFPFQFWHPRGCVHGHVYEVEFRADCTVHRGYATHGRL